MKKSIFQIIYDFIKELNFPPWIHEFLKYIYEHVILPSLKQLGQECIRDLQRYIIEASHHEDWSGEQKFEFVKNSFIATWGEDKVKDRILNLTIELVVNQLKEQGIIQ